MFIPTLGLALQTSPDGSALSLWADLALVVIAVAVVVLAVMGASLMLRFNRILSEVQRSTRQNFGPVSDRARSISDNVEFITQALRTDVEKLNASVRALSGRLQQASDRMEERIEEFNALLSVMQGEAEDIFLDTASTVRGVREGVRAVAATSDRSRRKGGDDGDPSVPAGVHPPGPQAEVPGPGSDGSAMAEGAAAPADDRRAVSAGED